VKREVSLVIVRVAGLNSMTFTKYDCPFCIACNDPDVFGSMFRATNIADLLKMIETSNSSMRY